jgi:hypothetical protein
MAALAVAVYFAGVVGVGCAGHRISTRAGRAGEAPPSHAAFVFRPARTD